MVWLPDVRNELWTPNVEYNIGPQDCQTSERLFVTAQGKCPPAPRTVRYGSQDEDRPPGRWSRVARGTPRRLDVQPLRDRVVLQERIHHAAGLRGLVGDYGCVSVALQCRDNAFRQPFL